MNRDDLGTEQERDDYVRIVVTTEDARELLAWSERLIALQRIAIEVSSRPGGPPLAAHVLPRQALHERHLAAVKAALGQKDGKR